MVLQETNSPFNQEQTELLNRLLPTLTDMQRVWLSGYLAANGMTAAIPAAVLPQAGAAVQSAIQPAAPSVSKEITLLFGSQTGNSQKLAKKMAEKLEARGFQTMVSSMQDFKTNTLKKINNLLIVVSTHGEGDPPDNALTFYEFLHGKRAPKLEDLRYSVLALGDTSYEWFCKTGKDFDSRLEELGGQRLAPRVDCDVDYDEDAEDWMNNVLEAFEAASSSPAAVPAAAGNAAAAPAAQSEYSRTNPFEAEVLENLNLNGRGSARETRHLEISLEGSNLQYEPGDSLGIYPENHPRLVDELIKEMAWNPDEPVLVGKKGEERPLREALAHYFEITVLTKPLLEQAAKLFPNKKLQELAAPGKEQELRDYLKERDLLDLVRDFELNGTPAKEFVTMLRKMPARLYSIASSLKAYPDEVHLTIRKVAYESHGRKRYGVCSTQMAERIEPGDKLKVYVHENPNFKMPSDPDSPVIMIGPGTGAAPFRAFLGEREETGAAGKTWLFFGDQHFATDFLYQVEWQRWLKDGVLSRMDVAFSRDTDEKVYVQHRMLENSKELYRWLQDGAAVYVCGDEKNMAHDVHNALAAILEQEGGFSAEEAAEYLLRMQQNKRYQRDVY